MSDSTISAPSAAVILPANPSVAATTKDAVSDVVFVDANVLVVQLLFNLAAIVAYKNFD